MTPRTSAARVLSETAGPTEVVYMSESAVEWVDHAGGLAQNDAGFVGDGLDSSPAVRVRTPAGADTYWAYARANGDTVEQPSPHYRLSPTGAIEIIERCATASAVDGTERVRVRTVRVYAAGAWTVVEGSRWGEQEVAASPAPPAETLWSAGDAGETKSGTHPGPARPAYAGPRRPTAGERWRNRDTGKIVRVVELDQSKPTYDVVWWVDDDDPGSDREYTRLNHWVGRFELAEPDERHDNSARY